MGSGAMLGGKRLECHAAKLIMDVRGGAAADALLLYSPRYSYSAAD